jgi:hypothetical protein
MMDVAAGAAPLARHFLRLGFRSFAIVEICTMAVVGTETTTLRQISATTA